MLTVVFVLIIVLLFILLNHSIIFHPALRRNILQKKYACTEDLWFKSVGNKKLVIFLHGMFSTPETFREIAELLVTKGWDVYVPALPASAATREDLRTIGSWAWEESLIVIRSKLDALSGDYQKTVLGGHSQGGSLAMAIATERDFDGLMVIASPVSLYGDHLKWWENVVIYLSGLLSFFTPKGILMPINRSPERTKVEKIVDAEGIQYPYTIYTFKRGLEILRQNLYHIKMPLLLAYCERDILVNRKNLDIIKESVSSSIIVEKRYDIPLEEEPYGHRHQLLNYTKTKDNLNHTIELFLEQL